MTMRSMELFAGAGGLALGMEKAGFTPNVMIEYDRHSCQTLQLNFGQKAEIMHEDVQKIDFKAFRDQIDVVSGGPPCQPFSIGGKAQGNQDRRKMFPFAIDAVRKIEPVAFIFENVRGLLRTSFSKYFEYILLQLTYPDIQAGPLETWQHHLTRLEDIHINGKYDGLKYNVLSRLLNAADYGVPQKRERVFIVGFREDVQVDWHFPEPTHSANALYYTKYITGAYWDKHRVKPSVPGNKLYKSPNLFDTELLKPWQTVRDTISDLPDPRSDKARAIPNHNYQSGARAYPGHTGSVLDEPSKTLKAGDHGVPGGENMVILDDGSLRYFSIRESARIQTFPDNFVFPASWTESMRQIGNAVPVELGKVVASSVYAALSEWNKKQYGN